jgi:hypothetical protein
VVIEENVKNEIIECDGFEKDDDDKEADALSWLKDQTQVIEFQGGVIIASF